MMDYTTDPSNRGTTGIFSLEKRDWDASMGEKVGIKSDIFPPCLETGTLMGTVTQNTALGAGIYPSLKVAAQTLVTWDKTYTPNIEHVVRYEELKTQWQDIYKNQLSLSRQRTHTKYMESPRDLK